MGQINREDKTLDKTIIGKIPDEVYMESHIDLATSYSIKLQQMAFAKLSATIQHFDHAVDVTEFPYYCSDCEIYIDGK